MAKSKTQYYHEQRLADEAKAAKGDKRASAELGKINSKLKAGRRDKFQKDLKAVKQSDQTAIGNRRAKMRADLPKASAETAKGNRRSRMRKDLKDAGFGNVMPAEASKTAGGSAKKRVGSKGSSY